MAWRTSLGTRSLEGSEAKLYLEAMQSAVDYIELIGDELDVKTGVAFGAAKLTASSIPPASLKGCSSPHLFIRPSST